MTDFTWKTPNLGGTSFRGYLDTVPFSFTETVARLKTLTGQDPTERADGYKTSVEFSGKFNDKPFTLYDYKDDMTLHIGGHDNLDVNGLKRVLTALLSEVVPTPYEATLKYVRGRKHGWPA